MGAKLGGSGGSKYVVEANSDLNVTPLVDVMLVLLIIFMVAAPMATVSIKLDLPPAVPPTNTTEKPPEPTYISIQNGGRLFISVGTGGNTETSLATLAGDLAGRIGGAAPQEERVFVRAQADVVYEDFMAVMNTLQENGFYKVGLLSEDIE